jgi:uncharacterized protein DUF2795
VTGSLYGMPITRFEITELIGDALRDEGVSRARLVHIARHRVARSAVLLVLRRLPDRRYRTLGDLWLDLPDVPDVHDPWEDGSAGRAQGSVVNSQSA